MLRSYKGKEMEMEAINNQNQIDEIEIDLREVLLLLLRKLWLILSVGFLTAIIGFVFSQFVLEPVYESTTQIYILNKQDSNTVTYSDVQLGTQLTKDYAELIESRYVVETVIEELQLRTDNPELDYEAMIEKITVTTPTDTRILAITVKDTDPMLAMEMANSIREVAAVHIKNVMDIEAVNVVDTANLPTQKASPSVMKWTLLGGCIGVFLVMAIVLIYYLLDDTIKTSDDVEKYLGLSTLALIPLDSGDKKN